MIYRENASILPTDGSITELTRYLALNWRGEIFSAVEHGFVEGARGTLLLDHRAASLGAFRSSIEDHGERGFVELETRSHRIVITAEHDAFVATINGARFFWIDRNEGDIFDENDEAFGWWTRPCNEGMERAVRPFIAGDAESARRSHLVAEGRTIASFCRGAGAHDASDLGGPRIASYHARTEKEDLAVLICALLETCFFGVIDAQSFFHRQIKPETVVDRIAHRVGIDEIFHKKNS